MLLAFASYSACSRSSSDNRMVKFFLGSINCPLLPISNPFFRFFFIIRHWKFPLGYSVSKTCVERICQIRKTPCVLQNLVRGEQNPPKTLYIYAPFGAIICNISCTTSSHLYYYRYYHKITCITPGITFYNLCNTRCINFL